MPLNIPLLGARAFEILCAAVVLGLSASLYPKIDTAIKVCKATDNHCGLGGLLPSVGYCAFVGAWGLLDACVGIAVLFLSNSVFFLVQCFCDGFAFVAFLAGGIRLAVLLSDATCNGNNVCDKLKADAAFLFLGFLVTLPLLVMGLIQSRRNRQGVSAV